MFSAVMAMLDGVRANTGTMLVPMRILSVTAATCASEVKASSPHASPIVMQLYPNSSANLAVRSVSRHDAPGARRLEMPIFMKSPLIEVDGRFLFS